METTPNTQQITLFVHETFVHVGRDSGNDFFRYPKASYTCRLVS